MESCAGCTEKAAAGVDIRRRSAYNVFRAVNEKGRTYPMKENRKLLKEVLKDIQHDMSDEEVLNLLADSKISVNPLAE